MRDSIAENGVVGAGGAGFPAAVKFAARAEVLIANAAECEPLLHKDKELLLHETEAFFRGLADAMSRVGARAGVIGVKEKYLAVMDHLGPRCPAGVRVHPLSDTYPAGDEMILVFDVTGRVVPPGKLPLDVGAVVSNVETLVNVGLGRPVTHKYLTVAGAVAGPVTLRVPVGTPLGEVIDAAGGPTEADIDVLVGGAMMGRPWSGPSEPVTKTTGGLVVLPASHRLIGRYRQTRRHIERIGRAACDQCSFCTELCPRRLLGHPVEPHLAMRALAFAHENAPAVAGTLYCCECNLCSLFSCPEDLDPKSVCAFGKAAARAEGQSWSGNPLHVTPHALFGSRRIPTGRLVDKLGLSTYRNEGPLVGLALAPARVELPLRQHLGEASVPVVRRRQRVREGDLVAHVPEGRLGANIHASIDGVVSEVGESIVIGRR